jgi:hypothetical protein
MGSALVNEGEHRIADILFGTQAVDGELYLGIYKDAVEPAEDATIASLNEVSGFGYARKTLTRGTWVITDDEAEYAEQTFLASGGDWGDTYGYFIATSSDDSGKLMSIEQFASARPIEDGKGLKITPKMTVG